MGFIHFRPAILLLMFFCLSNFSVYADKDDIVKWNELIRWRLVFENETPQPISIKTPDGKTERYWYFLYKVTNKTNRDVPWMVNIKIVIDKPKPGTPISKLPEMFHRAQIPEGLNKTEYLENLETYYEVNLPIVKREIMQKLGLYPRLSWKEKRVLQTLSMGTPESIFELAPKLVGTYHFLVLEAEHEGKKSFWEVILRDYKDNLTIVQEKKIEDVLVSIVPEGFLESFSPSDFKETAQKALSMIPSAQDQTLLRVYKAGKNQIASGEEIEEVLIELIASNLAMSQEAPQSQVFEGSDPTTATFGKHGIKTSLQIGEAIAGWKLLSASKDRATFEKEGIRKTLYKGANLEYLYRKEDKIFVEKDERYKSGMEMKGVYQGRFQGKKTKKTKNREHVFQGTFIPKGRTFYGIAIFPDLSAEMDFMAILVSGLIDPLVRRDKQKFLENEALMIAYERPGDEFYNSPNVASFLYKKWLVLSRKEIIEVKKDPKAKEAKDQKEEEEEKENTESKEAKEPKETKENGEAKEPKETKENGEAKEPKETKEDNEDKKDSETKEGNGNKKDSETKEDGEE